MCAGTSQAQPHGRISRIVEKAPSWDEPGYLLSHQVPPIEEFLSSGQYAGPTRYLGAAEVEDTDLS